ncbi:MAG: LL-diaminopimelate aminotransferase [Candidatus Omnitrophica bacterium]|nr:LL-diaminopimelate aminotransferase [Candidatus Omnitrophota bacterium]
MFVRQAGTPPPNRLTSLPPYLFQEVDRIKRELIKQGKDVIDLGVGDPDLPTPGIVVDELYRAAQDPRNHRYALDAGMPDLKAAIAKWYGQRFGVHLDPETEILPLLGSKEGIGHLPLALVNPGEAVLIPNPGYPVYRSGTVFAGGIPVDMPLTASNNYLPDLAQISPGDLDRSRLMFLNYPNNPTAACCDEGFFRFAASFAAQHGIAVAHDFAYSEIAYDGYRPASFLAVKGAKDIGIEFHSLSKTCNMTGWRVGFAVGSSRLLALLAKVKSNLDSGIFQAVQLAAIKALQKSDMIVVENVSIYQRRRDAIVNGLRSMGIPVEPPKATFYIWAQVPKSFTSAQFVKKLLEEAQIVVTPGDGFGSAGAGYFRISLTVPDERLGEAVKRMKKMRFA